MKNKKDISIVLGSYNRLKYLKLTIRSIRKEMEDSNISYEIIIIDGGSTDGAAEWLIEQKDIITIIQHNRGRWRGSAIERRPWGYFMNLGFKVTQGKYICMVSDDCLIVPGAIKNGYKLFENKLSDNKKIGAMAFYWRNWPSDKKYFVGLTLGNKMFVNHGMYLKSALEEIDYIDEDKYTFYYADGDLCLRLWEKEYECIDSPDSFVEHFSHANKIVRKTNTKFQQEDLNKYKERWKGIYYKEDDPILSGFIEKAYKDSHNTASMYKRKFWPYLFLVRLMIKLENNGGFMKLYKYLKGKK